MGDLKTLLSAAFIAVVAAGPGAAADHRLREVAHCTGRLSAQLEHEWLMRDDTAERTARLRSGFAEVLASLTPPGKEAMAMGLRIAAKHAQARLLTRATFNPDRAESARALRRARAEIRICEGMLLS